MHRGRGRSRCPRRAWGMKRVQGGEKRGKGCCSQKDRTVKMTNPVCGCQKAPGQVREAKPMPFWSGGGWGNPCGDKTEFGFILYLFFRKGKKNPEGIHRNRMKYSIRGGEVLCRQKQPAKYKGYSSRSCFSKKCRHKIRL